MDVVVKKIKMSEKKNWTPKKIGKEVFISTPMVTYD